MPSLSTVLKQCTNWCEKPPSGFEKYFDKGKKSKNEKTDDSSKRQKPFDNPFKQKLNRMSQG